MRSKVMWAALLGLATAVSAVSPAYAGTDIGWFYTTDGDPFPGGSAAAKAKFGHVGNKFTVCDDKADDFRARGMVRIGPRNQPGATVYNVEASGNGNCKTITGSLLREGAVYTFHICRTNTPGAGSFCASRSTTV